MSGDYKEKVKEVVTEALDELTRYSASTLDSLKDLFWEVLRRINKEEQ